jgi:hypothetical protein
MIPTDWTPDPIPNPGKDLSTIALAFAVAINFMCLPYFDLSRNQSMMNVPRGSFEFMIFDAGIQS